MLNQTVISGRLTKNPELRYVADNLTPVVNFTIAVERDYSEESGERKVDYIPVVAWNGNAKFISEHFGKGGNISVSGRLQSRSWTDQEGKRHYMTEVQADKAYFSGDSRKDMQVEIDTEIEHDFKEERKEA